MEESMQVFYLSLAGILSTFLTLLIKYCLKSKCSDVTCCGLLKIHRNVDLEEKAAEFEIEHGINDSQSQNNNPSNKRGSFSRIFPIN